MTTAVLKLRSFVVTLLLALLFAPAAAAQDPSTDSAQPEAADPLLERLDARAGHLEQLTEGQLAAEVDPAEMLELGFGEGGLLGGTELEAILGRVNELRRGADRKPRVVKKGRKRAAEKPGPSADLQMARARVIEAYASFLALPLEDRRRILESHAARRQLAAAQSTREADLLARAESLEAAAARIDALRSETLDLEADPTEFLSIDLGDETELIVASDRSARVGAADSESEVQDPEATGPEPNALAGLETRVATAEEGLDRRRLELWKLSVEERAGLVQRHLERRVEAQADREAELAAVDEEERETEEAITVAQAEAAAAAEEREKALEAAKRAQSEAKRLAAEEEARLLGVKQAHALFEAALAERRQTAEAEHEVALEWKRRVNERAAASTGGDDAELDGMYEPLREDLSAARKRLAAQLERMRNRTADVPAVGMPPEELNVAKAGQRLADLRVEVEASFSELQAVERELEWELAAGYRNDIVILNRARLRLLELASSELRGRVTGFGPDGVRQARREALQIGLELQYHALSLPRHADEVLDDVKTSPVPVILWLLKVGFAIAVFRWWRKRADELLKGIRTSWEERSPRTLLTRGIAGTAFYLGRIRKPLEWLGLAAVFFYAAAGLESFPELKLIWIVLLWVLVGSTIILFVDALAARESSGSGPAGGTAKLRLRSLRLIGLVIVYTGLVLSLAEEFVGRGAIYAWVLRTVWFLAIPIYLLLLTWWKPHVFAVFEREPASRFVDWVNERKTGLGSYLAATLGGVFLLGRGVARWAMRRAATFEATKRVLAYLFRREVAKQAEVTSLEESLDGIPDEVRDAIAKREVEGAVLDDVAQDQLDEVFSVVERPRSTISAVVAERGLGKTTFLRRLSDRLPGREVIVSCPVNGYQGFLGELATALSIPGTPSEKAIVEALAKAGPITVCIDDAQRLVRPTIGGLAGLDQLGALARSAQGQVSWVVAIGAPAWQYISRARGDRLFFDQVVTLRRWTEEQIGNLLRQRTETAGLDPSFEGLVVPRQYDETGADSEERSEAGFYRILWDYANGNPYVATFFWARSLFRREDGSVVVRLFVEPSAAELDDLALPLHFVLRALVQLETASKEELVGATRLRQPEVEDAIRFLRARGYLEDRDGNHRIRREWFRSISNMLRRQHLLAA